VPETAAFSLNTQETATLTGWIEQRGGIDNVHAALLANPLLPEATRVFAVSMLVDADAALDSIFKDAGRYIVAMCGVTLPRLTAMFAARAYVSAGRARSLLGFLCHLGFLTEVPAAKRGDPAWLQ
jgi:hypothetical protein